MGLGSIFIIDPLHTRPLLEALADVGYRGAITIELEDVPGCSRRGGPEEALDAFDREMRLSMRHLRQTAEEIGLDIA